MNDKNIGNDTQRWNIDALIDTVVADEMATQEDYQQLAELLKDNPDAQDRYLDFCKAHIALVLHPLFRKLPGVDLASLNQEPFTMTNSTDSSTANLVRETPVVLAARLPEPVAACPTFRAPTKSRWMALAVGVVLAGATYGALLISSHSGPPQPTEDPRDLSPTPSPVSSGLSKPKLPELFEPPLPQPPPEFVYSSSKEAAFTFGGRTYPIYGSIYNGGKARTHQWVYDPLMLPRIRPTGELAAEIAPHGAEYLVLLPIALSDPEADATALAILRRIHPNIAGGIEPSAVSVLPVRRIVVKGLMGLDQVSRAKLIRSDLPFRALPPVFHVTVATPDRETADQVLRLLPTARIDLEVHFAARTADTNRVEVSLSHLRQTELYRRLKGTGDVVYVHRGQLQQLSESLAESVEIRGVIERPVRFNTWMVEELVRRSGRRVDLGLASYGTEKWRAVYNAHDFEPTILQRALNKAFMYDGGSRRWRASNHTDSGVGLTIPGLSSLFAHHEGKFSDEELVEFLRQHDITAEVVGHVIVPRSVSLVQVNMADFESTATVTSVMVYPTESRTRVEPDHIDLSLFRAPSSGVLDAGARLTRVEEDYRVMKEALDRTGQRLQALEVLSKGRLDKIDLRLDGVDLRLDDPFSDQALSGLWWEREAGNVDDPSATQLAQYSNRPTELTVTGDRFSYVNPNNERYTGRVIREKGSVTLKREYRFVPGLRPPEGNREPQRLESPAGGRIGTVKLEGRTFTYLWWSEKSIAIRAVPNK